MSRGFLIYAHNNEQIDYLKIALCNALMIKSNLRESAVSVVTDQWALDWARTQPWGERIAAVFDTVIVEPIGASADRRFADTPTTVRTAKWHNGTRPSAFDQTPYEETILLDADYLVMDRAFDKVWGSDQSIRMNKKAAALFDYKEPQTERYVEPFGIPMYWATAVYFRKNDATKTFFDMVSHVKENYMFYQLIYNLPSNLYRNDFAFSIAAHTLLGFSDDHDISLPVPVIHTSFDRDDVLDVPAKNEMTFLLNDPVENWRFHAHKTKGLSVHVMNKFALGRLSDRLLALYEAPVWDRLSSVSAAS